MSPLRIGCVAVTVMVGPICEPKSVCTLFPGRVGGATGPALSSGLAGPYSRRRTAEMPQPAFSDALESREILVAAGFRKRRTEQPLLRRSRAERTGRTASAATTSPQRRPPERSRAEQVSASSVVDHRGLVGDSVKNSRVRTAKSECALLPGLLGVAARGLVVQTAAVRTGAWRSTSAIAIDTTTPARTAHAGRSVLQRVLRGRLTFTPQADGRGYDSTGPTRFDKLFSGIVVQRPAFIGTSVAGTEHITSADTFESDCGRPGTRLRSCLWKRVGVPNRGCA